MASSEYISREAAMSLIDFYWQQAYNAGFLDAAVRLGSVYREMEDLPAADVRPNVRGEWEETAISINDGLSHLFGFKCSNCGGFCMGESNYCPNCGADLRGEQDV